ncbi:MAG: hypothetical protein NTW96_14705, partial [Planctomycetia bacterium]|nr:hypothetical protein [Planctomycetia bacterium]
MRSVRRLLVLGIFAAAGVGIALSLGLSIDQPIPGKGDRHLLPPGPEGCFAQKVPVTYSESDVPEKVGPEHDLVSASA